jgi:hypothetical protein
VTLDQFCSEDWNDHATGAAGVFARLPNGIAFVTEPAHVSMLAGLIVHVAGAMSHATDCLRIVEANGSDPGEIFFAREALSRVKLAAGDHPGARRERITMAAALPAIEDQGFRLFAEEELAKLDAALGAG